ncbi:hypothetical protein D9M72_603090 [compost metagenome]
MIAIWRKSTRRITCAAFTRSVNTAATPAAPAGSLAAKASSSSLIRTMKGAADTASGATAVPETRACPEAIACSQRNGKVATPSLPTDR